MKYDLRWTKADDLDLVCFEMREILLMQKTLTRRYNKLVKEANAMEKRKED